MWGKGYLVHGWWKCKLVQPLWKTVWEFLKKLETELLYDPAVPLMGIYSEEMKALNLERYMHPMFTATLLNHSQDMEATEMSIDG